MWRRIWYKMYSSLSGNTICPAFPNEKDDSYFFVYQCQKRLPELSCAIWKSAARNDRKAVPESEEDQDCFLLRQMESEVVTELFEAIDELPERCREIFYMAYLQEKEEKQIAELLRVSVNTVKTQKQRPRPI